MSMHVVFPFMYYEHRRHVGLGTGTVLPRIEVAAGRCGLG